MSIPVETRLSPHARWRGLPLQDVTLTGGFWAERQRLNREVSLGHGFRMLQEAGNLDNLRLAAGQRSGEYRGPVFMDSDVYKWLEAVAYAGLSGLDPGVRQQADRAIALIEAAQAPDGYLNSYYQVVAPERRWVELNTGHELYCAGHLIQAAVAWLNVLHDDRLLSVARRLVEHIGSIFGPGKRVGVPGHPEIELALVELYRATGERDYLNLAKFFVDHRGHGLLGPNPRFGGLAYYQDRVPVREAREIEGHAVRALYLTTGVAELYLETGESALLDALLRQWRDFVERKLYITGGAGSRHNGEAFGHAYELSTERAYCETCAAIASIMWNWRLLLATGEARFADLIERTLYNGFLSGVSLDGERYFYVNPLLSRGEPEIVGRGGVERQPWFLVACCPPNVMRLLAALGQYVASCDGSGLQVHQYAPASLRTELSSGQSVGLELETDYPWHGAVSVTVVESGGAAWSLQVRVPAWCATPEVRLNGAALDVTADANGYIGVQRAWRTGDRLELSLPVTPRLTEPHPRIESTRGCVALERGPLVYCLEQADSASASVLDACLDPGAPLGESWQADLLGGVMTVQASGEAADVTNWAASTFRSLQPDAGPEPQRVPLTAIPYFAWANRQPGPMRVWIPLRRSTPAPPGSG